MGSGHEESPHGKGRGVMAGKSSPRMEDYETGSTVTMEAGSAKPALPRLPREPEARLEAAKAYWQRYLQVSQELHGYIAAGEVDEYLELGRQRMIIGDCLIALADTGYNRSAEALAMAEEIRRLDKESEPYARRMIAKGRQRQSTARAYDPYSRSTVGNILNMKQ